VARLAGGIECDDVALEDMFNNPDGLVGDWLKGKVAEMTAIATAGAPLQQPKNWSWGADSSSYMPRSLGYLKGGVRPHFPAYTRFGSLYGGVNAPYGPTLFLEKPARQLHHSYPFLSAALYAAVID